jgi:hypothetical protein
LEVHPDEAGVLRLLDLHAGIFGGELGGVARIEFGPLLRYELDLVGAQIRLEEFGRHNLAPGTKLSGLASTKLYLRGQGPDINDMTGGGAIDVPEGHLYNLPVLLDVLKVLGLRRPDGTAFDQAQGTFTIRGNRMTISRLDLVGNSFSLRGQGDMNLDGTDIQLDFFAAGARAMQMLPPILKDIPQTLSKHMLKIEIRGRLGDIRTTKVPMPTLVEPIEEMFKHNQGRKPAGPPGG